MSNFDRFDDNNLGPKPNKHSEDDVRRFRELLRNGGKDINNPEALEEHQPACASTKSCAVGA